MARMIRGALAAALFASTLGTLPQIAHAQADAAVAYQAGKKAFDAGRFAEARDLLAAASHTDPRNPEVFLWLGKADYQLGAIDDALAAWKTTLSLAPNEPYAGAMVKALTGQADAPATLGLVDVLLRNELFDKAGETVDRLLKDKALTDAQRARALMQRAAALIGINKPADAEAAVEELLLRYPRQADADQAALLRARAQLRQGGDKTAEAIAALRKLAADHPDAPAAGAAQFELVFFDLEQGVTAARTEALAKWLAAHADSPEARRAQMRFIDAYLALSDTSGPVTVVSALNPADSAAIAVALSVYPGTARAAEAQRLTQKLLEHFDARYARFGAYAAAIAATDALAKAALPASSRALVLRAGARYRVELAMRDLAADAQAGKAAAAALPPSLAELLGIFSTINREFPDQAAWREQAALAERLRGLGAAVPWPADVRALKPAYAWAVRIDLPIVEANADASAVESAVKTMQAIVAEVSRAQPAASHLALNTNNELLAVLAYENANWIPAMILESDLLTALAAAEFHENLRAGRVDQNAKLSRTQQQFVATLAKIVAKDASWAPVAVDKLNAHVQLWANAGYYAVAEQAQTQLASALPEAQARGLQLAIVNLWVRQAIIEHQRLAAAGLSVPRPLDDSLAKALKRLYELQAGVAEADPFLGQVRSVIENIVNHYNQLTYFDTAVAAAKVKSAPANAAAETFAQFELARLSDGGARRDVADLLKKYKASESLAVTPSTQSAIAAWESFITAHPADPLAASATAAVFDLASLYEQTGAYDAAHGMYVDFAAFATKTPVLSAALPGRSSVAERATFDAAGSLDLKAHAAFAKQLAEQQGKPTPPQRPAKISDEFIASNAAYRAFITSHPNSPLVGNAIQRVMIAALDYARADAWEIADGIFVGLIGTGKDALALRDPERLEFCRGMCQVGKVMPDHAKEVLATLAAGAATPRSDYDSLYADRAGVVGLKLDLGDAMRDNAPFGVPGGKDGGFGGRSTAGHGVGAGSGRPGDLKGLGAKAESTPAAATPAEPMTPPELARAADDSRAQADNQVLASISQQQANRAAQVAQLRGNVTFSGGTINGAGTLTLSNGSQPGQVLLQQAQQKEQRFVQPGLPVLSPEELARQQTVLDAAYRIFQGIRSKYTRTITSDQARAEIMLAVNYWRGIGQWQRASALGTQFLKDNPADGQLPQLRLGIAQDQLAWASQPVEGKSSQDMLAEVSRRFNEARAALAKVVGDFAAERALAQEAQWQIATSFLTQARAVGSFSPTLARGQYARAAKELDKVAIEYADHPQIGNIPTMLWEIAAELQQRGYADEAIAVWNDLAVHYPTSPLAAQAVELVAQTYQNTLGRPLRAAEQYVEINFARGGNDVNVQNAVFNIGSQLKDQKRWVEALHVLQLFVDSFPKHANAGQALAMVGQIHQANESWDDAIAAYQRVISEYPGGGQSVQEAKWSIAESIINLSKWPDAIRAYESYVANFPQDGKVAEANRRIGILKDLANYQMLVNEKGPKAFDAQFQMAQIIQTQLTNPAKAIVEYQKVATNYPKSHLAHEALYAIGLILLKSGEMDRAREVLHSVAVLYPDSPLADAALFQVGKSYEEEAQQLGGLNRNESMVSNGLVAQNRAYKWAQRNLSEQRANQVNKLLKAREFSSKAGELQEASNAAGNGAFDMANTSLAVEQAEQQQAQLTASQLADRQDKINAALRKAVAVYTEASRVAGGDKAGEALLRMAVIYSEKLGEPQAAMSTWLEIVRQFSGTSVAEEASWQIAQNYERSGKYAEAVEAYKNFLRNYRRSPKAPDAQFFVAENYEHLGQWVSAMDQYTGYLNNFPEGTLAQKAREQINFIKTYRL